MQPNKAQEYLTNLLTTFSPYILTTEDKKAVERNKTDFILQRLFAKKFRKQKLHPNTIEEITTKVKAKIEENKPIYFTIPFGGYKHFWNPSHPETDWAEIFTLKFLTEWISPILEIYEPGVVLEFISEDMILTRMDNYPASAREKYAECFRKLLEVYKKSLPKNFEIKYFRVGDKYNKEAIISEVEKLLPERWEAYEKLSEDQKAGELKRSNRSIFWNGEKDLTNLSEEEKQKRVVESRLIELAFYDTDARPEFLGDYFTEDNRIGICFSMGLSPDNIFYWIALGSTYASQVDYWIGRGILESKDGRFVNRIVSKKQYEKIKDKLEAQEIKIEELSGLKNYTSIEVIESQDWNINLEN
jgi:hypothetical protein